MAGETQSGNTSYSLTSVPYEVEIHIPEEIDKTLGDSLHIQLTSPSGLGVKRNGQVEIALSSSCPAYSTQTME